jgi:hypothetical protein
MTIDDERRRLVALIAHHRTTEEFRSAFTNLDDVFMNVCLQRSLMLRTPPFPSDAFASACAQDPFLFFAADRARLERTFTAFLFVLIEAWEAPANATTVKEIGRRTACGRLAQLIRQSHRSGLWTQMKDTRDYMCHRDRRALWDDGRLAVVGGLRACEELFGAFESVIAGVGKTLPVLRQVL